MTITVFISLLQLNEEPPNRGRSVAPPHAVVLGEASQPGSPDAVASGKGHDTDNMSPLCNARIARRGYTGCHRGQFLIRVHVK
jgi:hypothetical protein